VGRGGITSSSSEDEEYSESSSLFDSATLSLESSDLPSSANDFCHALNEIAK
jgi:hypothetical protein